MPAKSGPRGKGGTHTRKEKIAAKTKRLEARKYNRALRKELCDLGVRDWHKCVTCVSQCAYGKECIARIADGKMQDWTKREKSCQTSKNKELGARIRAAMIYKDVKNKEMAYDLGVSELIAYRYQWHGVAQIKTLIPIADYLGVSLDWLLGRDGPFHDPPQLHENR